jgi:Flp pilus assembly CpaF family ATPase
VSPAGTRDDREALAALRRVMRDIFGDLLEAGDGVNNVLIWPPRRGTAECAVGYKSGFSVRRAGTAPVATVHRFFDLVAGFARQELTRASPTLDVTLPDGFERIHIDVPPVVAGPACSIRKPYVGRITLDDYVRDGIMTGDQCRVLRDAVARRRESIGIVGPVDTGKTTLLRALGEEPAVQGGIPGYVQDPVEFEPTAPGAYSKEAQRYGGERLGMQALIADLLRVPVTCLFAGEVRRGEMVDVVHASSTGMPVYFTAHADGVEDALDRFAQMVGMGGVRIDDTQLRWIAKGVRLLVHVDVRPGADGKPVREVVDIRRVLGYSRERGFEFASVL